MTRVLALDLSIHSTGFALWQTGAAKPVCGTWKLADHVDYAARAFVRLQKNIMDLHRVGPLDFIGWEEPLSPNALHGHTNLVTMRAAAGLAAHVMSFCEAVGIKWHEAHQARWRRHFIGKMPRGTKTPDLKAMAMKRCRELGFDPNKHDAAEACGVLDYELHRLRVTPPWVQDGVLQAELLPTFRTGTRA